MKYGKVFLQAAFCAQDLVLIFLFVSFWRRLIAKWHVS